MLNSFQAIFFDFDGVILDSTQIKTETFRSMYEPYGTEIADRVVEHHLQHGGISRVEKIKYYHKAFLDKPLSGPELDKLTESFSQQVKDRVAAADWIAGAEDFITAYHKSIDLYEKPTDGIKSSFSNEAL